MKKIKTIAVLVLAMIIGTGIASARKLSVLETKAQQGMMDYLKSLGYDPLVYEEDGSVNFKRNGVLYWITFDNSTGSMLYTLNRKPLKFTAEGKKKTSLNTRLEIAEKAANMMSNKYLCKTVLDGNQIKFNFPVYATSTEEYTKVFPDILKSMENLQKEFDECYKRSRPEVENIHSYWMNADTTILVVPQHNVAPGNNSTSVPNLTIERISLCSVDGADKINVPYDAGLRKGKCMYIRPKVSLKAKQKGVYKVEMKIITPEGKVMVPTKEAIYTTVSTVDVKSKDFKEYELEKFGYNKTDNWLPGEYHIIFMEDGNTIYEDSFNIL